MQEQIITQFHGTLADGGPLYTETNPDWIIMEPWNAISSLAFLIPVIYWFLRIKGQYKVYSFLSICMVLLFLGGIGSTLYHGFRASRFLLMLDVLPIQLLTLLVSIYFWKKLLREWYYVLMIVVPFVGIRLILFQYFDTLLAINMAYFLTGIMIFLPALIFLHYTRYQYFNILILGIALFAISLFFRHIDAHVGMYISMGTHWLWHVTGAAGSFYLGKFLYLIRFTNNVMPMQKT